MSLNGGYSVPTDDWTATMGRGPAHEHPVVQLSRRELVVSAMYVNGASAKQIGMILSITENAAKHYIRRACEKMVAAGWQASRKLEILAVLEDPRCLWAYSGLS